MKIARCVFAFALLIPLVVTVAVADSGMIKGTVNDQNNKPVSYAVLVLEGTHLGASSDANGKYVITNLAAKTYNLRASAVGYRAKATSVTVIEGQTVTVDFTLTEDALDMAEVVTTGTYTPTPKNESTIAISTLSARDLTQANPRSTTEILRYVPGFTRVESSGGEVNENISIRGILGVEYVMFMEDGLPVFPTMHTFFMNADNLFRVDENIDHVEVVRGGNSALFGSNTPGAIINFIDKTGGPDFKGIVKATAGMGRLARYDANVSGPLGEDWRFNFGGFYRYDQGIRDPGFPGTQGGQIKGSITRLLGNGYFRTSVKIIDDRNQFILDLPFQNPNDPSPVPGFSDVGSMNTEEGDHISVPTPTGTLTFPLSNGLRTKASWVTADAGFNFENGWSFQNTAQIMQDDQEWNAIVPFNVMTSSDYFNSLGFPAGSTFQLLYTNLLDGKGNKLPFDPSSNAGLGLVAPGGEWHVEKPISAFQDQLTIKEAVGEQQFSLGLYFATYTQTNRWYFADILTDVQDNPHFLDLIVNTPTGSVDYTSNGFRHYVSNYVNGTGSTSIFSGVLGGALKLTDRLRADLGIRYETDGYVQTAENTATTDLDGNPKTTYDQEDWGNGTFKHFSRTFGDWAASAGLNYQVTSDVALYAQGSRAYKMPALDEFLTSAAQAQIDLFKPRETEFVEGGLKYSNPQYGGTLGLFWGQLKNNIGQGAIVDPATGNTVWVVQTNPDSRAYGVEVEADVRPIPELNVMGAGTFLATKTVEPGGTSLTAGGVPKSVINLVAVYTIPKVPLSVKADWHYLGARDIVDANYDYASGTYTKYNVVGSLQAYNYFNFGASYVVPGQGITIEADLLNAFQSNGFEEGNPRLIATGGNPLFLARPILPRQFVAFISYLL
ncbi:MAG TPA: TonB-dependent receptor [Bacteroidota bacterium]|nr:TonB-dependent receptor [Bacteroidota bacterium]